jgi:hypothetical protein
MKGTITTPGGITLQTTSYVAYPDKFQVEARFPNGDLTQVHAGGEAVILERTLTEVKLNAPVDETLFNRPA